MSLLFNLSFLNVTYVAGFEKSYSLQLSVALLYLSLSEFCLSIILEDHKNLLETNKTSNTNSKFFPLYVIGNSYFQFLILNYNKDKPTFKTP